MASDELWIPQTWMELMTVGAKTQEYLLNSVLNLKYDLERSHHHTIIRSISGRLKSMESLSRKLERLGVEISPKSAAHNLHDIIGIRMICSYLNDIDDVVRALQTIEGFEIQTTKDYIHHPKPSGYRSLHVIACCTIAGKTMQCEIQLRTTAMDSWAALEHQMRYKKKKPDSAFVNRELLECSDLLFETDQRMEQIYQYLKNRDD